MLKQKLTITVLGCGASGGVPLIGCRCPVCCSLNPKNKRSRVSIVVQSSTTTILVDTSPDLREQCLREGISKIDAIIYTHAHADHLHGIDDVRCFNYAINDSLNTYADAKTLQDIGKRFDYVFLSGKPADLMWYRPALVPCPITPYQSFSIGDIDVLPILQQHGAGASLGLRFGNFAYSTDTNGLSGEALNALSGIDTWIVDCLRYNIAPTHAHLEMSLGWIKQVRPKQSFLTHLNHEFDYDTLLSELPQGVYPAYDGLKLTVD